jgi:hypothetical protein
MKQQMQMQYLYVSCSDILWVVLIVARDITWSHQNTEQVKIHPQYDERGEQKEVDKSISRNSNPG